MDHEFFGFGDGFRVLIPNPPAIPNFRDIFLPIRRKNRDEPNGFPVSRFLTPPPSEYLCVLCQNVVKKPLECRKCGKLYCDSCIAGLQIVDESSCNKAFSCNACGCSQEPRQPSQVLLRMITELKIKCVHFDLGCQNYITIEEMNRHELVCPYREVLCGNFRHCKKSGLIKDFIETEAVTRSIYSHISNRAGSGRGKCYTCSENCKKIVAFDKLVTDKQHHKALLEYYQVLLSLTEKEMP
ncbi:hypothetical protein SteCoe_21769 [Stentor coeruleus]|uniref:TRAF-type domain-containing protein n=1 Tax=Stentor coeruleus TaxID=5963 RepID=A0A1R2BNU1_9CILI|nr:hypothetical protein SteCoe_21769 [Stentor coeruleus]